MPRKKKDNRRAGLTRFADEIQPPAKPEREEEARVWRSAEEGTFEDFEWYLAQVETQTQNDPDAPEDVKAEILGLIGTCREQLAHLPPPKGEELEHSLGGRAQLLAFAMYALARNFELKRLEFGLIGELFCKGMDLSNAQSEGGKVRAAATRTRDELIRGHLRRAFAEAESYAIAIRRVIKLWPPTWGKPLSEKTLKNRFPLKNLSRT